MDGLSDVNVAAPLRYVHRRCVPTKTFLNASVTSSDPSAAAQHGDGTRDRVHGIGWVRAAADRRAGEHSLEARAGASGRLPAIHSCI